jgi:hemerythrin-like metal-binding protein
MSFIAWQDDYSINVREIDDQHRALISLVNELHDAVKSRCDTDTLSIIMAKLIADTEAHFSTEESLMVQYDYPGYAIHKAQHDELLGELRAFAKEVTGMPHSAFRFNFDVSTDWLMHHIGQSDSRLGKFLNEKEVF